ncbi:hypothetical protein CKAH01_15852 [Colletotrichum kahawae]|uniref:Myb-like domain-containing protein n=1 Tax=Colletotrichum kahawae TaxID=34407 RepID=A0AAD9YHZ3_COLKA|nr:hypothetical protein CKAH01_15852 [Colletotrichum kahawae]
MSCDNYPLRPDGLPTLNVDNVSRRGKLTGRQRGRSPTTLEVALPPPNFSSTKPSPQKSERVPFPPIVTTIIASSGIYHTCGLSAKHLLRISNTVQTLAESSAELSGSRLGIDLLKLLLRFIRDYTTKRPSHNTTSTGNSDPCDIINQDPTLKAIAEMLSSEIVKTDESSSDSSGDDSDSDSSSVSSNHSDSPDAAGENSGLRQRRCWTPLDESRLRAWVWEGKEWSWIAGKLRRSEQAVVQH